ncbi:MAG: glycosyltransferase family 4 protein [Phycisphaerales bacterium]
MSSPPLSIVHVTCEHAADDARVTRKELGSLVDAFGTAWIVARPPRGDLDARLTWIEAPAYARATRPRDDWAALDAAVRQTPAPRVVHAHEPETVLAAVHHGWCDRAHLVYDAHEFHGGTMAQRATGLKRAALRWIGDRRDARAARAAGTVITVNDELAARYAAIRGSREGVHVFTNAPRDVDDAAFADEPREPHRLIYLGGLTAPRGARTMAAAWPRVRDAFPLATLDLVGPGLDAAGQELLANPPDGMVAHGPQPHDVAMRMCRRASIALLPFLPSTLMRGRPVKLLEYAMAGCTTVCTEGGIRAAWVREHSAGVVIPGDDPVALADACITRLRDPILARAEGDAARQAARAASWERSHGPALVELYRDRFGFGRVGTAGVASAAGGAGAAGPAGVADAADAAGSPASTGTTIAKGRA